MAFRIKEGAWQEAIRWLHQNFPDALVLTPNAGPVGVIYVQMEYDNYVTCHCKRQEWQARFGESARLAMYDCLEYSYTESYTAR